MNMEHSPNLTEQKYNDLYKYALNIAHFYVGFKECAYDIAQNSILSFLSSKAPVKSPYSWLRTTVKRESLHFIDKEKKEQVVISQKKITGQIPVTDDEEDSDDIFSLNSNKVKVILNELEYKHYILLKKWNFSAYKCAKKEHISLNTLKKYKKKIKKNLTAEYLFRDGWRVSPKILDFNQYLSITRCITNIIESVKKHDMSNVRDYLRKVDNKQLQDIFDGVDSCLEWNITYVDNYYKLLLACSPANPFPKVIEIAINFNQSKYLYIMDVTQKQPLLVVNKPAEEVLRFKEKGKINLTQEQIVSILTDKKTET